MFKILALIAVSSSVAYAAQTCSGTPVGPPVLGQCPSGTTLLNSMCCLNSNVVNATPPCADKTNANGVNECPGLTAYCNNSLYKALMTEQCSKTCGFCSGSGSPSTPCADLTNPSTGRSDCAANASKCNDSLYRDLMRTQCPKTCGYCR